ncbi:hypothetical protein [Chryseobacterium sp.]|uniref:hypothetical protein n=1 Tax=Chryseobacterium sp. TaxID=1871047 RepID=UPI00289C2AF9|nr:hypothetical protein [Chryseobacterium sp.]
MSAIKKSGLRIFFPMLLLLIFSCSESKKTDKKKSEEDKVEYVIFSIVGGHGGYYKTIKVTHDSLLLATGNASSNTHKSWKQIVPEQKSKEILGQLNIHQFMFIKSSESRQPVDGVDETFQIKTKDSSYVFVNAYNDKENYQQLKNFKTKLNTILPKQYQ